MNTASKTVPTSLIGCNGKRALTSGQHVILVPTRLGTAEPGALIIGRYSAENVLH